MSFLFLRVTLITEVLLAARKRMVAMDSMISRLLCFGFMFVFMQVLPVFAVEEIALDAQEEKSFMERIIEKTIVDTKTIKFEKGPVDSFSIGFVFQGTLDMSSTEQTPDLRTAYPLYTEIWASTKLEKGKSEIKLSAVPSKDVDAFDKKFNAIMHDIYYKRKFNDHNSVLIGNSRIPIGTLESMVSPANMLLVKRSQITNAYGNLRATGLRFQGDYSFVDYDLGGYSSTRSMQDLGEGLELASWVNLKPFNKQEGSVFKKFKIGAGTNYGKRDGGEYTVLGVGSSWEYKKWLAMAEFADANGSNGVLYNPNESYGFNTTLGYYITDKVQLLGRYDIFDPNKSKPDDMKKQYTAGLNYYVLGNRLKFSLNYMFEENEAVKNDKSSVFFMTQVQI